MDDVNSRGGVKKGSTFDSCLGLTDPLLFTRARLYLGMALEGQGDIAGARAQYERVIEQWGKARPRSVTAEKAAQRLQALPKPR